MTSLPTFSSSCIAPSGSDQNVFLFGVPSPGRLEAYSINISNPLAPESTFVSATSSSDPSSIGTWDAKYSLGCYAYLGDKPPADSPISVVQFGSNAQILFLSNGTWVTSRGSTTATPVEYISPNYFSIVGSTNGWNWFLAKTTLPSSLGGSAGSWRDIRIGSTARQGSQE